MLAALIFITCSPVFADSPAGVARGKELYHALCASCHGVNGVGQNPNRPGGGVDENKNMIAPSLDDRGHAWHHSPSQIYGYIKNGSVDPASPMPSFGDRLTDGDITSIVLYIRSLWPEKIIQRYRKRFADEMQ